MRISSINRPVEHELRKLKLCVTLINIEPISAIDPYTSLTCNFDDSSFCGWRNLNPNFQWELGMGKDSYRKRGRTGVKSMLNRRPTCFLFKASIVLTHICRQAIVWCLKKSFELTAYLDISLKAQSTSFPHAVTSLNKTIYTSIWEIYA